MYNYFVNKNQQKNGDHEFHKEGCPFLPHIENRVYLGIFGNCKAALISARAYYLQVDGCYYCCKECHRG